MNLRSFSQSSTVRFGRGFTLLELAVVMTISALLLAWALPALDESIKNNRTASQNMLFLAMLNFTKSEAVRRSASVNMVFTLDDNGWDAVVEDPNNEVEVEGCVIGQLRCASSTGAVLTVASQGGGGEVPAASNTDAAVEPEPEPDPEPTVATFELSFNNRGYIRGIDDAWAAETFFIQHEDCAGQNQRYRIDVTPTGQVSSCNLACDSTEACQ